jgi:hypothetical protein
VHYAATGVHQAAMHGRYLLGMAATAGLFRILEVTRERDQAVMGLFFDAGL